MGNKKKRNHADLEDLLQRPWCYYCERDFDDLKILIDHQRAKHFKCERCGRRLNTAGGLQVHMNQVHKETLASIDNALPNRTSLDVEIFGTEGIPAEVAEQHRQRVLTQYAQAEAERRAATGNPPPGGVGGEGPAKKAKTESLDDIKKRKAEFKAKKAAEAAAAAQAGNSQGTPTPTEVASSVNAQQVPVSMSSQGTYGSFPQPYPPPMQIPGSTFTPPQVSSAFNPPAMPGYGASQLQPHPFNPIAGNYGQPFGNGMAPGGFPDTARGYGVGSSPMPYSQVGQFQSPPMHPIPPGGLVPGATPAQNGVSSPVGLPQRPAFGAPPVNAAAMQQMHQGQHIPPSVLHNGHLIDNHVNKSNSATPTTRTPAPETKPSTPAAAPSKSEAEPAGGKKTKKDDKSIRMVYTDNEISPEEKMSHNSRYAFTRDDKPEQVLQQVDAETIGALNNPMGDQMWGGPLGTGNFS